MGPWRRWPIAALIAVLALGACSSGGGESAAPPSPVVVASSPASELPRGVEAEIPTKLGPNFLAPAGDSVWLSETDAGSVARIDPGTNEVTSRLRVGGQPGFLTAGFGDVWLTSFSSSKVWRIDSSTGKVAVVTRLEAAGYGLSPGFGSMWVAGHDNDTLVELEPDTGHVLGQAHVPSPTDVVAGFGKLWVPSEDGHVYAIDPATLKTTATVKVEAAHAVAVGFGSVWASSGGDADVVTRIDPDAGKVIAEIETEVAGFPDRMAALAGKLWVGQYQASHVLGIDPKTNEIAARLPAGSGAAVVSAGFGALWAANYDDDTVWRLKVH